MARIATTIQMTSEEYDILRGRPNHVYPNCRWCSECVAKIGYTVTIMEATPNEPRRIHTANPNWPYLRTARSTDNNHFCNNEHLVLWLKQNLDLLWD